MSIIKNILQIIGMIILIFCGLLGMLLFIMGMVEAIPSMAVCGIIILVVSVVGSIFIGKKISKTFRPKKQNKINMVAENTDNGEETPLIISCHGAGAVVRENSGQTGGIEYSSECAKQGYAILDVCGSRPDGLTVGCPEHIFALHKAYLYATKHYNLSKRVLVAGASMGGQTALNFAHTFHGIVVALGLIYPRLNMDGVTIDGHYCIGTWDKTDKDKKTGYSTRDRIIQSYHFPSEEWCKQNTDGFNPYLTRSYVGADGKRVVIPPCPIKVWQGMEDKTVDPVMAIEFVESVRRSGSYIELHCMEGIGHSLNDVMRTELAMWFNRFI